MSAGALTVLDLAAKMSAVERAALRALLDREDVKDKSYLELPMGREVGRYLRAKRKELTDSSYRAASTPWSCSSRSATASRR